MSTFLAEDITVGTMPGKPWGYDRTLTLKLRAQVERTPGIHQTIEHDEITGPLRLSLSGVTWAGPHSIGAGQITHELANVTHYAPGYDAVSLARIAELWERWHMNDMRAACAHQVVPETPAHVSRLDLISWRLDNVPRCPVTGYKYGSAWLVEPLPADVVTELRQLLHIDEKG